MTRSHDRGSMAAAETAAETDQPRFWNVPNSMTVARLGLAAVVFAFMGLDQYAIALAAFIIAALSDALDGYFARLLKQGTPIGRQLDPLVDKVIVSGCYIYLASISEKTGVYPWMVTARACAACWRGRGQSLGPGWPASSRPRCSLSRSPPRFWRSP